MLTPRSARALRNDVPSSHLLPAEQVGSWVELGKVGKSHGLHGGFFLTTPDRRQDWDGYKLLALEISDGFALTKVTKAYVSGGMLALQLSDILSKEQADNFRGARLFVHTSQVKKDENDILVGELVGLRVRDEHQRELGKVTGVVSFGAQNNLKILLDSHVSEEVIYPLVDAFVQKIDLTNGFIQVVYLPEFLEDLPLSEAKK